MCPNWRPSPMTEPAPVVLVIDDESQIRRFLRAGLELDGFVVQEVETGSDAMRAVTLTPRDLVILDGIARYGRRRCARAPARLVERPPDRAVGNLMTEL